MDNVYYGAASTPTEDFLAHYGVKGMKWGVRKAIERGNDRALRRQRVKAERKLRKLQKLGSNGKKYAARAAAYGAGAVTAGHVANKGTRAVWNALGKTGQAANAIGDSLRAYGRTPGKGSKVKRLATASGMAMNRAGKTLGIAGRDVGYWGIKNTMGSNAATEINRAMRKAGNKSGVVKSANDALKNNGVYKKLYNTQNSDLVKAGSAVVAAGLGAAAARNAYRAATAKKHARQAEEFRQEMNKAFAGTKYANGVSTKRKKRR